MPIITPNFNFAGRCEEALLLYQRAFGARIGCLLRYEDADKADSGGELADGQRRCVYHAELFIGDQRIMMCDNTDVPFAPGLSLSLTVTMEAREDVITAYEALKDGATIIYPPHSTTYSSCTVTLVDKFGFRWGIMTEQSDAPRAAAKADMVRPAAAFDVSRIAEILVFAKRTAYRDIFNDDAGSFNGLRVLDVAAEYESGARDISEALVYDDGIVKGVLSRRYDAPAKREAELREIYVEPSFTGRGIGKALMSYFLTEASVRGQNSVRLWVIKANAQARRFYEALGFSPDGGERAIEGTSVPEISYSRPL